jgi:hypothetical protein
VKPLVRILHGGPFGGLEIDEDTIVVSDAQLLKFAIEWCVPRSVHTAKLAVIEVGRLQSKNEIAPGVLWELLQSRGVELQLPSVLLVHDDPRLKWRASRDSRVDALLDSLGTVVEKYRGQGHVQLTDVDLFAPRRASEIDDGSEIDFEALAEQMDYTSVVEDELT